MRDPPDPLKRERVFLPPLVRAMDVEKRDLQLTVRTHGTVVPRAEGLLAPEVSGRILEVSPSLVSGGFFEKDEILAVLDPIDYELAVVRAEAQVAQAEARLDREEAEAEVARAEWEWLGTGEPSPLLLREPQLAEAKAMVASAEAALQQANHDLRRTKIRAPYSGRVMEMLVDVGEYVNRGAPLARMYATDYAEIRIPIPDEKIAYIDLPLFEHTDAEQAPGPKAKLRTRFAGKDLEWEGTIVRTEGEIDPKSRMVTAVARVDDPYGRHDDASRPPLSVGLFLEVEIEGESVSGVVEIPRSAMRGRSTVYVIDDDGRLSFREVEVLKAGVETIVIRSGLEEGDRVCLSALDAATDGMKVRTGDGDGATEEDR